MVYRSDTMTEVLIAPVADRDIDDAALDAAPPPKVTKNKRPPRLLSLDLIRGAIMVVMAWDHCKDILWDQTFPGGAQQYSGFQAWSGKLDVYDNLGFLFVARFISHFCAPGFFFTMGISMSMFARGRTVRLGWRWSAVVRHFCVRGLVLLLVGRVVDAPFFVRVLVALGKGETVAHFGHHYSPGMIDTVWLDAFIGVFEVMTGLGLVMMAAGLLLPLVFALAKRWPADRTETGARLLRRPSGGTVFCLAISVACFAATNAVLVYYQAGDPEAGTPWPRFDAPATTFGGTLVRFLLIPGTPQAPLGHATYPLVAWLGVTILGVALGQEMGSALPADRASAIRRAGVCGGLALAVFAVIRSVGGTFGNLRGWPRGDGIDVVYSGGCTAGSQAPGCGGHGNATTAAVTLMTVDPVIEFFNVCKYPPSLAFASLTLGVDCLGLFFLSRCEHHLREAVTQDRARSAAAGARGGRRCCSGCRLSPCPSSACGRVLQPALVFGRAPLFFYILHFWVYATLGGLFFQQGVTLLVLIPIWICVLTFLYFLVDGYGHFKATTSPGSLWRYI